MTDFCTRLRKLIPTLLFELNDVTTDGFTIVALEPDTVDFSFENLRRISVEFHTTNINFGSKAESEGGYSEYTPSEHYSVTLVRVKGAS